MGYGWRVNPKLVAVWLLFGYELVAYCLMKSLAV